MHRATLSSEDLALVDYVPVTSTSRTLLDLSSTVGARRLRRFVRRAEFERLVNLDSLTDVLRRHPRRRGRQALAALVNAYSRSATRSELEDEFLAFCAAYGIPLPETNVLIDTPSRRCEVDCLWREGRLVVELDGRRAHFTLEAFEEDRARDRALIAAGWQPLRVTWSQVQNDRERLAREVRSALARRTSDPRRFTLSGRG